MCKKTRDLQIVILSLFLVFACLSLTGCAQSVASAQPAAAPAKAEAPKADPLGRDTPQSAVEGFLEACRAKNYTQARRYLNLRQVAEDKRRSEGPELARQLEQILDHDPKFDIAAVSQNPEGDPPYDTQPRRELVGSYSINSAAGGGKRLDVALERVTFKSGLSVWLFSQETVQAIPLIAHLASDSAIDRMLPAPMVNYRLVDTSLWRWIALVLLFAGLWAVSALVARLASNILQRMLERVWKREPKPDWSRVSALAGPIQVLFLAGVMRAGMEWIAPSARLVTYIGWLLALLFFAGIGWLAVVIVDLMISGLRHRFAMRNRTFSYSVLPLASRLLKLIILLLALAGLMANRGYHATTILAGLGIGGIAVALAAQKTIENLFGGVAVVSDRPVFVGDFCKFGDRVGTVEDIGVRSTRIRTNERTLVTVPNGEFSSMTLENFSMRDKILFNTTLNLRRDTTPDQVRTLLKSITQLLADRPKVEGGALPVRFVGVGSYSLDLEIFTYVMTQDFNDFLQIRQELLLQILDEVEAAGTALAYPTQASIINYPAGDASARDMASGR